MKLVDEVVKKPTKKTTQNSQLSMSTSSIIKQSKSQKIVPT